MATRPWAPSRLRACRAPAGVPSSDPQERTTLAKPKEDAIVLEGTVIDYVSEGPLREGFVFKNPNATSSCGCGSSFSA